jgi:predicted ABC-type ATPase
MDCNSVTEEQISSFIEGRLTTENSLHNKVALVLVGGPGSGKSRIKDKTLGKLDMRKQEFVDIEPDIILTELFKNDNTCRTQVNTINDRIYETAIEQGKNIIFDGTGKDFDWYFKSVIQRLVNSGYAVNLAIVISTVENALKRIQTRTIKEGRTVDVEYATSVYTMLATTIPKYVDLRCNFVNTRIFVYNNAFNLQLIYQTHCDNGKKSVDCVGDICDINKKVGGKGKSRRNTKKKPTKRKTKRRRH